MATCKHCGNTLILNSGRCLRCGKSPNDPIRPIGDEALSSDNPPIKTFTVNGVSFNMILVEGGRFYYGLDSDRYEEEVRSGRDYKQSYPLTTIPSFYIGETQVTQALWEAVMKDKDPYLPFEKETIYNPSKFKGKDLPLDFGPGSAGYLSDECLERFFNRLNDLTNEDFRLPVSGEWEFAAKGGNKSKGYRYAGSDNIDEVAWYFENSGNKKNRHSRFWDLCGKTHPVKTKKPNELGIYDMSGNVAEFVGLYGVHALFHRDAKFRGGGWLSPNVNCKVTSECYSDEGRGFRLALSAENNIDNI